MTRRFWTEADDAVMWGLYGSTEIGVIAKRLRRTAKAIHQRAHKLGLVKPNMTAESRAAFLARVAELHAQGMADPEICMAIGGVTREWIGTTRRSLGLPSNRLHPRNLARVAAKTREQVASLGLSNLGELRGAIFRASARVRGWPDGLRKRHADILDALAERGPMTRPEIADAIGLRWRGSRKTLGSKDPGGSYLAFLQARGLVVSFGRIARGKGRGHSKRVYSLALGLERNAT